jgi:hypothetical protein
MFDQPFHPTRILTGDTNIAHMALCEVRCLITGHDRHVVNEHHHTGYLHSPGQPACLFFMTAPCRDCSGYNEQWMAHFFEKYGYREFAEGVGLRDLPPYSINWFEAFSEARIIGYSPTPEQLQVAATNAERNSADLHRRYSK